MNLVTAYLLLLMAAVLEAAGDALVRVGLHSPGTVKRSVSVGRFDRKLDVSLVGEAFRRINKTWLTAGA